MYWFRIENLFQSIRPLQTVLKVFGFTPILDNSPKASTSFRFWRSLLYTVFFVLFYVYAVYSFVNREGYSHKYRSRILGRAESFFSILFYTAILVSIISAFANRHNNLRILHKLNQMDRTLVERLQGRIDHQRIHLRAVVSIGYHFVMSIVIYGSYQYIHSTVFSQDYRLNVAGMLFHFVCGFAFMLTLIVATIQVLLLVVRYEALNDVFRMYFPTTPSCGGFLSSTSHTETVICNEKEQLAVLKQIKILHDKLNDVVELVNYCFSVQITFCVGLCFVIGVVCSFGLFRAFIYRNELFYMGVLNFVWYMYYLFFVLFFIAVGSKITREGKRIGVLVHKAINCASSSAVINELNIFSQQLLHRSPVITCGLFVYDWTLLYTMIGATATYLIILIQFDVSFPNLVNVNGTQTAASGV
ncbi:AAEL007935-PD, partial [Aedes aegypti]